MSTTTGPDLSHRRVTAAVRLQAADFTPLAGADVTVRQVQHAFGFGCTGLPTDTVDDAVADLWLGLFDTATLAFYWGRYEPQPGRTRRAEVERDARWFAERGVRLKGHPLVWHTVKAPWVDDLPLPDAEAALRGRIRREVGDFAGLIETWDVINEAVIMPRFTNEPDGVPNAVSRICAARGRVEMVRLAVEEARAAGHHPTLVINDFDLGPAYEQLLEELLGAGVEVDAIGLQSHMHQGFRGEEQLLEVCERFARFGLPLHWTETTLVSGDLMPADVGDLNDHVVASWPTTPAGEERQADEIVRHYRTLASHPSVQSITYWGLGDAGAWLGAPAGLLRADGSPKPAYDALRELVRGQWWLEATPMRTDADGRLEVTGWAGSYEVVGADGRAVVPVAAGGPDAVVTLAH